ncbi:hypothetical protein [Hymenobacter sp. 102]|uniref:hypothetical protein n=1 Tax=Hymenobacter sp. 102 TaxID=3403152 RepID=UPI003CEDE967
MEFFTESDLELLHSYADKEYKGSQRDKQIESELKDTVWAKTKHWGELLATDELKMISRRSVTKQAGKTKRGADGRQRMRKVYRFYTWARLLRPDHDQYGVFFTVGVDGHSKELGWKLDCRRAGTGALNEEQIARFDDYQQKLAPQSKWVGVTMADLEEWDWKRLVKATKQFMAKHAATYEQAIAHVWHGQEPGKNKLARVCWNTLGWQRPSGPVGKSTTATSHESGHVAGFGAEEWLFDYERLIDGYHYGFLQALNSVNEEATHAGRSFNIRLFTRNDATKEYYYVGRLMNAHVLTKQEREKAERVYLRNGWRDDMQQEIVEAGGTGNIEMGSYAPGPFNVRFRPEDVERPDTADGLELIDDISEWTASVRYKLFNDYRKPPVKSKSKEEKGAHVIFKDKPEKRKATRQRQTQGKQIELAGLHDKVQDQLFTWLKQKYAGQTISSEAFIEPYGTRIDVVRKRPDGSLVFYEVKVYPHIKACVREALGQLLEYAHWTSNDLSRELVIVSFHPTTPEVEEYLKKLEVTYKLPLSYLQIPLT